MPGNRTTGDAPEFFSIDPIELIGIGLVGDEPAGAIRGDTREVLTQDFGDLIRILREHKVPEEAIGYIDSIFKEDSEKLEITKQIHSKDDVMPCMVRSYVDYLRNDHEATKLSEYWINKIFESGENDNIREIARALTLRTSKLMENGVTKDYIINQLNRLEEYYSNPSEESDSENCESSDGQTVKSGPNKSDCEYFIRKIKEVREKLKNGEDINPLGNYDDTPDIIGDWGVV